MQYVHMAWVMIVEFLNDCLILFSLCQSDMPPASLVTPTKDAVFSLVTGESTLYIINKCIIPIWHFTSYVEYILFCLELNLYKSQ